jgi:hypothetical protein
MDESRREKGRKEIEKRRIRDENRVDAQVKFVDDFQRFIETQKKKTGIPEEELINEVLSTHVSMVEFDETTGKASLVFDAWKGVVVGEETKVSQATLKDFRDLRENFAPVSAGIEWHRDFTSGGGFLVQIDDPTDKNQIAMREEINLLNRNVFQDQYVKGLDNILDIEIDIALTDGCAAAEIVYQKEVVFEDYIDEIEEVVLDDGKKVKVLKPKEMTSESWKDLGGITRLKIIEDAYTRLVPYRHPKSGEILYWTLDEKGGRDNQGLSYEDIVSKEKKANKPIIKFYPWEILWLSWNQRGTNLKGMSMIQSVYKIAKMVQEIQTSVGKGFNRWANKKYFFVCGSERRQWNKVYRTEFLKAMEKMIKNNWVGIPVPAEFEIKEIGGEQSVFDGKNILDHLIGMIAAGMQYPREFLEVGRTQASDKAWLAWTVRYGRSQLQIRRAIEHQLWERHLWCKFGMTSKRSKKGVPKEEQVDVPTYVPKLQWKAEGQWLKDAKMKLLTGLLNVANPIDYPLKMPVQKEMGATIGIGEIDWKDIEELFETQNKIKMAQVKMELKKEEAKLAMIEKMSQEELEALVTPAPTTPQTQTPEEKLQEQEKKRAEGGVSRTTKETGTETKKGQSKSMGGTRLAETIETAELLELPQDILDGLKKLVKSKLREQENKTNLTEIELENAKKTSENLKIESEATHSKTALTEAELKAIKDKAQAAKELAEMEKENANRKKEVVSLELESAKQKKKQRDDLDEEIRKVKKK